MIASSASRTARAALVAVSLIIVSAVRFGGWNRVWIGLIAFVVMLAELRDLRDDQ